MKMYLLSCLFFSKHSFHTQNFVKCFQVTNESQVKENKQMYVCSDWGLGFAVLPGESVMGPVSFPKH